MIYPVHWRGSDNEGKIIAIVGMQNGSEGKGAIAAHLASDVDIGVRSGAANAGHTIYHKGKKYIMRQIPVAWINPGAHLVIGAGSLISLEVLLREIETIQRVSKIIHRLHIDHRAHVITQEQIEQEQIGDLGLRIGSTSALSREGIGIAQADKVLRKSSCLLAKNVPELRPYISDTVDFLNTRLEDNWERVMLEGTQGFGLSLDHGHFPFVTSRDVSVEALAASVGLSLHKFDTDIIGVTRTYPIRVAGRSGPFGDDAEEITWSEVAKRAGARCDITERTSVTKKVRRVSTFSKQEFAKACRVNRPTCIALTFADYLDWSVHEKKKLSLPVKRFIEMIEQLSDVPVSFVKTGPATTIDFEIMKANHFYRSLNALAKKCQEREPKKS